MPSQSVVKPNTSASFPQDLSPRRFRVAPLLLALLVATPALAEAPALLQASSEQSNTARIVTRQLSVLHYSRIVLNDTLSEQIWNRYLADMDNQRVYFLAADIQSFEPWRLKLDDQLKGGQMVPAFAMYNRFQQRQRERLEFANAELENNSKALLDFTGKDTVENDRKNAPWARSKAELDQLWRLRLKAAALALKLSGKSSEEALTTLRRRYKSQLTMLGQTSAEDAFQTFMNAFTESYDPHTQYMS
ncbi:MAG: tail-specific protease, partial [Perlucidibaca sp.]